MTIPNLLIAFLISILIGAIFHIIRGGDGWRLLIYILISCVGFFLAQWFKTLTTIAIWSLGNIDIGIGIAGSILLLIIAEWLLMIQPKK